MNQNNEDVSNTEERYYLPRHTVCNSSNSTSHTRVFLNGSCRSINGFCSNDMLPVGPTIQQYEYSIVLRFRTYKFAFTTDTGKKCRQVKMHKDDRILQRILWWKFSEEQLRTYELAKVTYGTALTPDLATRCLQQLAEYESKEFSLAP